jgi:hypothetical protein
MMGSRPVVGSSKKMISGCVAMARGETHALLHAARQFGRIKLARLRRQADFAEFLDRDLLGVGLGQLLRRNQTERHVFPNAH